MAHPSPPFTYQLQTIAAPFSLPPIPFRPLNFTQYPFRYNFQPPLPDNRLGNGYNGFLAYPAPLHVFPRSSGPSNYHPSSISARMYCPIRFTKAAGECFNSSDASSGSYNKSMKPNQPERFVFDGLISRGCTKSSDQRVLSSDCAGITVQDSVCEQTPLPDTPINRLSKLCRYSRVQAVYDLVDEKGPAHLKTFVAKVTLSSGDVKEEYLGEGNSIQKAKHEAALAALQSPSLRPLPEKNRTHHSSAASSSTAVGRLNSLAIKMGSWADYHDSTSPDLHWPGGNSIFNATVTVQGKIFTGCGVNRCIARNIAAQAALDYFEIEKERKDVNKAMKLIDKAEVLPSASLLTKAPVSQLYEECRRLHLDVSFESVASEGPAHCQTHHVICKVGTLSADGKGASKKVARHESAEKVLRQVRELFGDTLVMDPAATNRRKSTNLVKNTKARPDYGKNINPVSRLYQLQQASDQPDPIFEMDCSAGRSKEFVVTAKIPGGPSVVAVGPNKKLAKRFAAENLMRDLGFQVQSPVPLKSSIRLTKPDESSAEDRKVKFDIINPVCDDRQDGRVYRKRFSKKPQPSSMYPKNSVQETLFEAKTFPSDLLQTSDSSSPRTSLQNEASLISIGVISGIARELMSDRQSPSAVRVMRDRHPATNSEPPDCAPNVQDAWLPLLEYLCRVANMTLKKETFSRQGPHCEFVTVLTVGEPIESIGCGNGSTEEKAVEDAAWNLLTVIGEQGDENGPSAYESCSDNAGSYAADCDSVTTK